jgi:hypothetical protein
VDGVGAEWGGVWVGRVTVVGGWVGGWDVSVCMCVWGLWVVHLGGSAHS